MLDFLIKPFFTFLPYEEATLLSGIVWGQKQYLSPEQYENFKSTGLLHLLVLSGQNITLLTEFIKVTLIKLNLKRVYIIASQVGVALFYLFTFSSEPSIVRASIMSLILTTSKTTERNTHSAFILLISGALMIVVNRQWLYDISFWLSFSSTAGIILIYPSLNKNYNNPLLSSFFIALSAQIATLPITALTFREISLLSVPMNVLVSWLIEPIMVLGVCLSFIGNFLPLVGFVLGFILVGLLTLLNLFVETGYLLSPYLTLRF